MSYGQVTIIILHWRGVEHTLACLESLQAIDYPYYRILLVDNGALQNEMQRIIQTFPDLEVVQLYHNLGFAGGANAAINVAFQQKSEYILLLNNDTLVSSDFLRQMLEVHAEHPDVGILTPKVYRASAPQHLAGLGFQVSWCDVVPVKWNVLDEQPSDTQLLHFDAVSGAAMLIKRSVFEQIGLFDERFFFYYEDTDFCLRARRAGFLVSCFTGAKVYHTVAASSTRTPGLGLFYLGRSRQLFFQKHQSSPLTRLLFLLREPLHVLRMVRAQWCDAGIPANAIGYIGGCLAGVVMTLRHP